MKNILIADSQAIFCEGIKSVLSNKNDFEIKNVVSNKNDLYLNLKSFAVDILILDFETTEGFEISDFSILKVAYPKLSVFVINANKNKEIIYKVLKSGVKNYILKDSDIREFEDALKALCLNEKYFSKYITDVLISKKVWDSKEDNKAKLTNKEIEIIKLLAKGLTTKDIANKIFISHHTVTTHRKNILNKLGFKNTSELVMYAVSNGIVDTIEYYI